MAKIFYEGKKFSQETQSVILQATEILEEYEDLGYDLTLRQLYYQFVARDLLPNRQQSYNRLGSIVNDARLAGLIDWHHIVDRTRNLRELNHWNTPEAMIRDMTRRYFHTPKWDDQPYYVEVWIEKDALVGVIQRVANQLDVPYFSCRGYTSQSEMWGAAQRLGEQLERGKSVRILHLGDHDPSGIDMTRDIRERLYTFIANDYAYGRHIADDDEREERLAWSYKKGEEQSQAIRELLEPLEERFGVDRLALNMDQVRQYQPPPNPAKLTDARARGYIAEYGHSSWELDALPPDVLGGLVEAQVEQYLDADRWAAAVKRENTMREWLERLSSSDLGDVMRYLDEKDGR
jgi:hypothetical protein